MRHLRIATCLTVAWVISAAALSQSIQINRENKTIAISASDEATATADIAAITVGLEAFAPDSSSAYEMGGKFSQNILAALRKAGSRSRDRPRKNSAALWRSRRSALSCRMIRFRRAKWPAR